jgi:hypothetical protein
MGSGERATTPNISQCHFNISGLALSQILSRGPDGCVFCPWPQLFEADLSLASAFAPLGVVVGRGKDDESNDETLESALVAHLAGRSVVLVVRCATL